MKKKKWKTKKQRQQWWKSLTLDEQQEYIEKRQASKAKYRKNNPKQSKKDDYRYPSKIYPWLIEGVNDSNREQWQKMIAKKNPWLKVA